MRKPVAVRDWNNQRTPSRDLAIYGAIFWDPIIMPKNSSMQRMKNTSSSIKYVVGPSWADKQFKIFQLMYLKLKGEYDLKEIVIWLWCWDDLSLACHARFLQTHKTQRPRSEQWPIVEVQVGQLLRACHSVSHPLGIVFIVNIILSSFSYKLLSLHARTRQNRPS